MKAYRNHVPALLLAAAAAGHTAAWAHATLQSATPARNAELASPPREISLRFNEKLEPAFSSIKLIDGAGKTVTTARAAPDGADPSVMKLAVPPLAPGRYTVQYTVVGHDGHRRKGDYSFTVK